MRTVSRISRRSITDTFVLQCNLDRRIARSDPRTFEKASLEYAQEVLAENGFPRLTTIAPRGYSRPLVIGRRTNRSMPLVRRGVSAVSRASVRLLFGRGIGDVNVPYRLVRGALLRDRAATLPANLFAPNVILSGLAIRRGWRILEVPVAHVGRRHGASSLGRFNVLRPAALSLWQTVRVALNDRARAAGR